MAEKPFDVQAITAPVSLVPVITSTIASATLHYFGRGGHTAGEFHDLILRAVGKADTENREKLRSIYPAWVRAYEMGHNETYGIDRLAEIAGAR